MRIHSLSSENATGSKYLTDLELVYVWEQYDGQRAPEPQLVYLQEKYPDIYAGVEIKWNFTKFLIERNGHVYGRYETTTEPLEVVPVINSLLLK
ncbi:hypothetical protein YSY22_23950 [Brevibacillus formosus]|uniref:hypothetical protein n=1 Tax=Brevibacillus sp. RS1.1 TaxID=2738982 RepID=UPI0020C41290|nr:hypothetical protein [Brevibacillus sp. RS1.1]